MSRILVRKVDRAVCLNDPLLVGAFKGRLVGKRYFAGDQICEQMNLKGRGRAHIEACLKDYCTKHSCYLRDILVAITDNFVIHIKKRPRIEI